MLILQLERRRRYLPSRAKSGMVQRHKELRWVKSTCAPAYLLQGASQRARLLPRQEDSVHPSLLFTRQTNIFDRMEAFSSLPPSRLHMTSNIHLSGLVAARLL